MSSENTLIHRREEDYKRHGQVSSKICRNLDPNYHPFHRVKSFILFIKNNNEKTKLQKTKNTFLNKNRLFS